MLSLQEKISSRGVKSLTDLELLTLLLDGLPNVEIVSQRLLDSFGGSLASLAREDIARLRMIEGIGLKRAQLLSVSAEWGRRCAVAMASEPTTITKSSDVVDIFRPYFSSIQYEECWILYLTVSNRVIEQKKVSQGGVISTVVDHRLIVKRALELLSTQIIMVHNHPSGAVDPSPEDIELTKKVKSAAALFDIDLVDHLIISQSTYYSFRNTRML